MFGDIGHGSLLTAAGIYLIFWKEKIQKHKKSIWNYGIPVRYLVTMMGLFAVYCGFIYNDFMSLPFNLFGTCYQEVIWLKNKEFLGRRT